MYIQEVDLLPVADTSLSAIQDTANVIGFCTTWRLTVIVFGFTNATHAALMTSQANTFNCTFPALHLVPDVVDGLVLMAVV